MKSFFLSLKSTDQNYDRMRFIQKGWEKDFQLNLDLKCLSVWKFLAIYFTVLWVVDERHWLIRRNQSGNWFPKPSSSQLKVEQKWDKWEKVGGGDEVCNLCENSQMDMCLLKI